jgi:hypothetical protein
LKGAKVPKKSAGTTSEPVSVCNTASCKYQATKHQKLKIMMPFQDICMVRVEIHGNKYAAHNCLHMMVKMLLKERKT